MSLFDVLVVGFFGGIVGGGTVIISIMAGVSRANKKEASK